MGQQERPAPLAATPVVSSSSSGEALLLDLDPHRLNLTVDDAHHR